MRRDWLRDEAGVAGTEYALIVGLLWVMVFAIFPNLPPLWRDGFEIERKSGEGQTILAQNLGLVLPNGDWLPPAPAGNDDLTAGTDPDTDSNNNDGTTNNNDTNNDTTTDSDNNGTDSNNNDTDPSDSDGNDGGANDF